MERISLKNRRILEQAGGVALLGLLVLFCAMVLQPFFTAMLWAGILVFATWPIFCFVRRRVARGNAVGAAAGMTVVAAVLVVAPLVVLARSSISGVGWGMEHLQALKAEGVPQLVKALRAHPLFAEHAEEIRGGLMTFFGDTERLTQWGLKVVRTAGEWLLRRGVSLGWGIFQVFASLLFMFYFYVEGEAIAGGAAKLMERMGGPFMAGLQVRMGRTLNVVVRGTVGTAVVQAIVAGIGFKIFGVPNAGFWGVATFVLGLIPFGPPLLWIPVGLWLLARGEWRGGIGMLIYGGVVISSIDNVVRPVLIAGSGNFEGVWHRRRELVGGVVLGGLTGAAFLFTGLPWYLGIAVMLLHAFSAFAGVAEVALLSGTIWLFSTQQLVNGIWLFLCAIAMIFVRPGVTRFLRRHMAEWRPGGGGKGGGGKGGGGREGVPFALMLIGVTGGLMAFGFIGLFLGPVLLALGYDFVLELAEGGRGEGGGER